MAQPSGATAVDASRSSGQPDVVSFARRHGILLVTVAEIVHWVVRHQAVMPAAALGPIGPDEACKAPPGPSNRLVIEDASGLFAPLTQVFTVDLGDSTLPQAVSQTPTAGSAVPLPRFSLSPQHGGSPFAVIDKRKAHKAPVTAARGAHGQHNHRSPARNGRKRSRDTTRNGPLPVDASNKAAGGASPSGEPRRRHLGGGDTTRPTPHALNDDDNEDVEFPSASYGRASEETSLPCSDKDDDDNENDGGEEGDDATAAARSGKNGAANRGHSTAKAPPTVVAGAGAAAAGAKTGDDHRPVVRHKSRRVWCELCDMMFEDLDEVRALNRCLCFAPVARDELFELCYSRITLSLPFLAGVRSTGARVGTWKRRSGARSPGPMSMRSYEAQHSSCIRVICSLICTNQ